MDVESVIMYIASRNPNMGLVRDGDYKDGSGLLVCGKCGKRREAVIEIPSSDIVDGEAVPKIVKVPCACDCDLEEQKKNDESMRKMERRADARALAGIDIMESGQRELTFADFEVTADNKKNFRLCKRYVEVFDKLKGEGKGLLMCGSVGTGKSYSAFCIVNELKKRGYIVLVTSFTKILEYIQERGKLNGHLSVFDLVVIDDLGAERSTDYALEKVYGVVDELYRANVPTIYTTNMVPEQILNETDIRYRRLYDRILERCYTMGYAGKSWRRKKIFDDNEFKKLMEDG